MAKTQQDEYSPKIQRTFTTLDRETFTFARDRTGNDTQARVRWLVFWTIYNRSRDHGPLRASVARFVGWLACTTRPVRDALADLLDVGLIHAKRTGRRSTSPMAYTVDLDRLAQFERVARARLRALEPAPESTKSQNAKSQNNKGTVIHPQPVPARPAPVVDKSPSPPPTSSTPTSPPAAAPAAAPVLAALRAKGVTIQPKEHGLVRRLVAQHGARAVLDVLDYALQQGAGKPMAYVAGIIARAIGDGLHVCQHRTPEQTARELAAREAAESAPRDRTLAMAALAAIRASVGIRRTKGDTGMASPVFCG